jgi:hypothetical protein
VKILNLDELQQSTKTVKLGGVEYKVLDMTVEQFIESTAASIRLKDEKDPVKQLKETVALIRRAIPDAPADKVNSLQINQLEVLMNFINSSPEQVVEELGKATPESAPATTA